LLIVGGKAHFPVRMLARVRIGVKLYSFVGHYILHLVKNLLN